MNGYRQYRYWSPVLGGWAVRLSMADVHNGEFFVILPVVGKANEFRDRRETALDRIEAAIASGREPGEVELHIDGEDQ